MNYYNEFCHKKAEWLRQLIGLGAIPEGEVDERSIKDVRPGDLRGFAQCHFFAGIGGWSEALLRSGIPSTRPLWTGSCPCQAFSSAGRKKGFDDHRDLWPAFFDLIRECHPELVLGEQVENALKFGWLDRLYADMEGEGYVCGAAALGAHSSGADHIRQRLYWVFHAQSSGSGTLRQDDEYQSQGTDRVDGSFVDGGLRNSEGDDERRNALSGTYGEGIEVRGSGCVVRLHNTIGRGLQGFSGNVDEGNKSGRLGAQPIGSVAEAVFPRNFWSDAVPHRFKDNKFRRFESRIFPLVDVVRRKVGRGGDSGSPYPQEVTEEYVNVTDEARTLRLTGYGDAICVETATMFIQAVDDVLFKGLS